MEFKNQLVSGRLIRRYKRFLADIELDNGDIETAHCTNSGSMKTCIEEGAPVYLSESDNPKRRTKYTWEMIFINNGWIGVNTMIPNIIVFESIKAGLIDKLKGYDVIRREVKFEDSRFDVYLENKHEECFVEVKNVTMKEGDSCLFPDAVTTRGRKHLKTLVKVRKSGMRAVMIYIIQRMDVDGFGLAKEIDPEYADSLVKAMKMGVEVMAFQVKVSPSNIELYRELPIEL